jgi:hypothetical protein
MSGSKNGQQKIAILLVFEALKRLRDKIEFYKDDFAQVVDFETEGYLFGTKSRKIKAMGSDFSDAERLYVYQALNEQNGPDNNEGLLLEAMYNDFMSDTHVSER